MLEGTRSGLLALRHLLDHARRPGLPGGDAGVDGRPRQPGSQHRDCRAAATLCGCAVGARRAGRRRLLRLLADYGIAVARVSAGRDLEGALAAADADRLPGRAEDRRAADPAQVRRRRRAARSSAMPAALTDAYRDLASRLGAARPGVPDGPGRHRAGARHRDRPELGPLIVVGAGGVLVELLADRAVALPPVSAAAAAELLAGLRVARLLAGVRGAPPADLGAVTRAIGGLSELALELGDQLEALDINPLICGPHGASRRRRAGRPARCLTARRDRPRPPRRPTRPPRTAALAGSIDRDSARDQPVNTASSAAAMPVGTAEVADQARLDRPCPSCDRALRLRRSRTVPPSGRRARRGLASGTRSIQPIATTKDMASMIVPSAFSAGPPLPPCCVRVDEHRHRRVAGVGVKQVHDDEVVDHA